MGLCCGEVVGCVSWKGGLGSFGGDIGFFFGGRWVVVGGGVVELDGCGVEEVLFLLLLLCCGVVFGVGYDVVLVGV